MNKTILIGRLTKNPELQIIAQTKVAVCRFSIAVNRQFENKDGDKEVDFINCVAWRKQAENLSQFMTKGSLICVEGRIQVSNYTTENEEKKTITEVITDNITFLESKGAKRPGSTGEEKE